MGEGSEVVYFDLDGTLLNASSEKTLTGVLAKRRPWRIPHATVAWVLGQRSVFSQEGTIRCSTESWSPFVSILQYSRELFGWNRNLDAQSKNLPRRGIDWNGIEIKVIAWTGDSDCRTNGWAMARVLGMDAVWMWAKHVQVGYQDLNEDSPFHGEKENSPVVEKDAEINGHDLSECYGYGNTLEIRGLCESVAMQSPSIRKALCKNLLRNRNGKLSIGLPEFIYPRIERCPWTKRHFYRLRKNPKLPRQNTKQRNLNSFKDKSTTVSKQCIRPSIIWWKPLTEIETEFSLMWTTSLYSNLATYTIPLESILSRLKNPFAGGYLQSTKQPENEGKEPPFAFNLITRMW